MDNIKLLETEDETLPSHNTEIANLKKRLQNIRENRMKGSMIRSRAQLNKDWEKPSKYFLNLEKRNYINKSIPSLTVNETVITDSREILKQQHTFYSSLLLIKRNKRFIYR